MLDAGHKPYWATNSADGRRCFVSASGDDKVTVIDYASERIVATIPVGDHPQRMRTGVMRSEYLPPGRRRGRPADHAACGSCARAPDACCGSRLSEDARCGVAVQRARRGRWRGVRVVTRHAARRRIPPAARARCASPGRYRLAVTATDPTGNRSAPRLVRFRIAR